MSDTPAQSIFPTVSSSMAFVWLCTECKGLNWVQYDNWNAYDGLQECSQCEKAHHIKEPWK